MGAGRAWSAMAITEETLWLRTRRVVIDRAGDDLNADGTRRAGELIRTPVVPVKNGPRSDQRLGAKKMWQSTNVMTERPSPRGRRMNNPRGPAALYSPAKREKLLAPEGWEPFITSLFTRPLNRDSSRRAPP
jgi:hypothetical protein